MTPHSSTHRSRLYSAYVDVPQRDFDNTVAFYGELLGRAPVLDPEEPEYASYGDPKPTSGIELYVQAIGEGRPRVHLDIETDDIEAEVARLKALGATEVERIHTWVVLNDPVGTVFCVIRVQDADRFDATARTWD
ncbi:MAG: VOC family protein [Mycobacteriales bacterium]